MFEVRRWETQLGLRFWQTSSNSRIDPHYAIAGFLVGALVGVIGVGGGSLMTPILIVLFGVSPATGTDPLFAAATKTVGRHCSCTPTR